MKFSQKDAKSKGRTLDAHAEKGWLPRETEA
jgi:hypothetical protein